MYGLLLEGIFYYVKIKYGEDIWEQVVKLAGIPLTTFNTHKVYNENYIPALAEAASDLTGFSVEEVLEDLGVTFVAFVGQYGYDGVLKVLGRHLRDFLNGLDNLHEYLRFSYPKLKPPSFFCVNESKTGLTLHYRSRRRNFIHYVKGQIRQVAKSVYDTEVEIEIVSEFVQESMINVILRLHFTNHAYKTAAQLQAERLVDALPVPSDVFFEVFPFNLVFNRGMTVRYIGDGLKAVMPELLGHAINQIFDLTRPLVGFSWESVMMHTNNVFEIVTKLEVKDLQEYLKEFAEEEKNRVGKVAKGGRRDDVEKAQAKLNALMKGGSSSKPTGRSKKHSSVMERRMKDINDMFNAGLFINDLSMHDSSRDLILAGTQQSAELKLALDQEQQKSKKLEEFMKRLHVEMKRTDQLLYQMIPRSVAERLRRGEDPVATCETFECVTVLFSDVVGFTTICSKITPLQVVTMLNSMYTKFDTLSEKHRVYKVETIADSYMIASGAPKRCQYHAAYICEMALEMMASANDIKDPSSGKPINVETIGDAYMVASGVPNVIKYHACYISEMALDMIATMYEIKDPNSQKQVTIRVGAHSGSVVAGVVGLKMPRYCLFGDAVNTASRMETNSEAQKIHISETTKVLLEGFPFSVKERGTVQVKILPYLLQ
ncbi:soluble guanylate cyclase 88E-like [Tubulanus polymorphus]|uniref:soluble guanylate cyclase 88E-like n=1 Tax=Tubulanus polymorphus TaxID=672921 RepID=UPI003DA3AF72